MDSLCQSGTNGTWRAVFVDKLMAKTMKCCGLAHACISTESTDINRIYLIEPTTSPLDFCDCTLHFGCFPPAL